MCPNINVEDPFIYKLGDNDTKTGIGNQWKKDLEDKPATMLKRAIKRAKNVATKEAVNAAKKESLEIDVENGPTSEAVKEIENAMKVVEEVAATGSSSTGSSSTGGVTGATGGAATGNATGGATGGATGSDDATGLKEENDSTGLSNGKFLRRRR